MLRSRRAMGGGASAAAAGMAFTLARVVRFVAAVVIGLIAVAIVLIVLDASTKNTIVWHLRDWGHVLAGPFAGIFSVHSHKLSAVINYGVAILVYAAIAWVILALLRSTAAPFARRTATPV